MCQIVQCDYVYFLGAVCANDMLQFITAPYDSRHSGEAFRGAWAQHSGGAYMAADGAKMRPNDALNGLDSWTFRQRLRDERRLGLRETVTHRGRFARNEAERKVSCGIVLLCS